MKNKLQNIGRIAFGVFFIIFGINHFINADKMVGMLSGWPIPYVLIYLSGLALILAGVSFIIKKKTELAGILLAVFLLITTFGLHVPGLLSAGMDSMMQYMPNILKDLSLASAALYFAGTIKEDEASGG